MHRTLKKSTASPSAGNIYQQQDSFNRFQDEYNNERPHEALEMRMPAEVYTRNRPIRKLAPLTEIKYPGYDMTARVDCRGMVYFYPYTSKRTQFYLGQALYGEKVALKEKEEGLWEVRFMHHDLGVYDEEQGAFTPLA